MKKIIIAFLCLALVISTVACASDKKDGETTTETEVETETEALETTVDEEGEKYLNFDFSKPFDERGYWKDIKASDYVTLCDYSAIIVPTEAELTEQDSDIYTFIGEYLLDNCTVSEIPESMYEYQSEALCNSLAQYAKTNDSTYSEMLESLGIGSTENLIATSKDDIENQIKYDLIIQAIAEEKNIVMDDELLDEYMQTEYGVDDNTNYINTYGLGYLMYSALGEMVLKTVAGTASVE